MLLLLTIACGEKDTSSPNESGETCDTADTGMQVGLIDPECRCEEASAAIGVGVERFEPLADDACLQMVHGPQGGWHLPSAVLADNTRSVISILAWVEVGGQRVTDELSYRVQLVDEGECQGSFPNMFLYLTTQHIDAELMPPEVVACQEATVTMCIDDTGGNQVCAERTVRVAPDPLDVEKGLAEACELCP